MLVGQIMALAIAVSTSSAAPAWQVAVVIDDGAYEARPDPETGETKTGIAPGVLADLAIVERAISDAEGGAELAVVRCVLGREGPWPQVRTDFGTKAAQGGLTAGLIGKEAWAQSCWLDADVVRAALERLAWRAEAHRRIVVVTQERAAIEPGRRTLDEVMDDAAHAGVVVHALAYDPSAGQRALEHLRADLSLFVRQPTAPNGRSARHLRQGALRTGGSYHVRMPPPPPSPPEPRGGVRTILDVPDDVLRARLDAPPRWPDSPFGQRFAERRRQAILDELERREEVRAERAKQVRQTLRAEHGLDVAYGPPVRPGRDALDELAAGRLRPSEVRDDQLPGFLAGAALEPLLDALWNFVDARAVAERVLGALLSRRVRGVAAPVPGDELAQALLSEPRLAPSER